MRALLERWHTLESDRCRIGPPTSQMCADVKVGDDVYLVMFDRPSPKQLGLLLAAVIEAITSKGWDCRLTSNAPQLGAWHAIVWTGQTRPGARTYRPSHDGQTETPAAALLTAYVAALEAEAGQ